MFHLRRRVFICFYRDLSRPSKRFVTIIPPRVIRFRILPILAIFYRKIFPRVKAVWLLHDQAVCRSSPPRGEVVIICRLRNQISNFEYAPVKAVQGIDSPSEPVLVSDLIPHPMELRSRRCI